MAEELDFGDAPDPPYPTYSANNGASHAIVPGAPWLGDGTDVPDSELDGQPNATATGDDADGNDDEDGVAIPNPLFVGVSSTINVTVGASGWLDAWIDWNGDGTWQDPAERIFGGPVAPGVLPILVTAPGPFAGQTFARFRIHTDDQTALQPTGFAEDGEVEDHEVWIEQEQPPPEEWKWRQPPDLSEQGFDVECMEDRPILLADDFECTQRSAITNIVIWGSWLYDELPIDGPNGMPNPSNVVFTLSFHADVPKGVHAPWSMPGETLWVATFPPGSFEAAPEAVGINEGWYDPATSNHVYNADWTCWRYTFPVDPTRAFVQTGLVDNAVVYWLDLQARPLQEEPVARFGWKTTPPEFQWNDDACWAPATEPHNGFWWDMHYPPSHLYHRGYTEEDSFDLAFMLFGGPVEEGQDAFDFGDAPDAGPGNGPGDYSTLLADNGAQHLITRAGPWLGTVPPDAELDGQPTAMADGDDLRPIGGPDDEDGVLLPTTPLFIGHPDTFTIVVGGLTIGPYQVDGWIDWNQNGVWGDDLSELVVSGTYTPGVYSFAVMPPPGIAVAGLTYARFRVNSGAALPPTGYAADGEVEDYLLEVAEPDFGDAPDPGYPTLIASGGASHRIVPGPWLGDPTDGPDPEPDGQPDANATGDDLDGNDDENGVHFPAWIVVGQTAVLQILVSDPSGIGGLVDAWIDWNGDGDWNDAGEQIHNTFLPVGFNPVPIAVPANATNGTTFARFRISSAGGLTPNGPAPDGEVEDHELWIDHADWGDAPDNPQTPGYPTLAVNNGAWHVMTYGLFLGASIDSEGDGQPSLLADGDDLNPAGAPDDEDGVVFTSGLYPGFPASLQMTATGNGILSAWLDGNGDGDWDDPGEQVLTDVPLSSGVHPLVIQIPPGYSGPTYMRFRYSSISGLGVRGMAPDGEVEDYRVVIEEEAYSLDFGDAPNAAPYSYPVTLAQDGARHINAGMAYAMGTLIDSESDGQPSAEADGDDVNGSDDEDGVLFPLDGSGGAMLIQGSNMTVKVVTPGTPWLSAWVDFNGDGDWNDAGENIFAATALIAGTNDLMVTAPVGTFLGPTYARFRTSSLATALAVTGGAPDGEVEDYLLTICQTVATSPVTVVITNLVVSTNAGAQVMWNCDSALLTQPQACTNLVEASTNAAAWTPLAGLGSARQHTDPTATNAPTRFYRISAPYVYP